MMKLYSGPLSLFTAKVRIALDEKGIQYELLSVPFSRAAGYSPKLPEMLAINPKGQVPVLIDDDLSIYDSTLLLEYLEERNPEPALFPKDIKERARCRQFEAASDEIFFPKVFDLVSEVFYKPDPATRDAAKVEKAKEAIAVEYDRLERALAGRDFLCRQFTVADIAYFLTMMFATTLGAPPGSTHSNVAAWSARVASRPAVAREIEGMTAASQRI